MRRDPTQFRERFKAYKNGKLPYKNGRPTEDELFESFRQSLPDNQKPIGDYRTRRYWELNGKPNTFGEAIGQGMYTLGDSGQYGQYGIEIPAWHANSVTYNASTGNYEFMKPNTHPTRWMEDVYGYWGPDMLDFRENYKLEKGPIYDKYVPKKNVWKLPKFKGGTEPTLSDDEIASIARQTVHEQPISNTDPIGKFIVQNVALMKGALLLGNIFKVARLNRMKDTYKRVRNLDSDIEQYTGVSKRAENIRFADEAARKLSGSDNPLYWMLDPIIAGYSKIQQHPIIGPLIPF